MLLRLLLLIFILLQTAPLLATSAEDRLMKDLQDGHLDEHSLIRAGLIASGVKDVVNMRLAEKRLLPLLENLRGKNERERAQELFSRLHKRVLRNYSLHALNLRAAVLEGRYNCVSASVLYNGLLEQAGIESAAVLVPSHVFSLVYADGQAIEVETTSPRGFAPARTMSTYKAFLKERGLVGETVSVDGGKTTESPALIKEIQGQRVEVNKRVLIALLWSNRGVQALKHKRNEEALILFQKAAVAGRGLERFRESRDAMIHNMVVSLIQEKAYEAARIFMEQAAEIPDLSEGLVKKFQSWKIHAINREAIELVEAAGFKDAERIFEAGLLEFPREKSFHQNRAWLYTNWLKARLAAGLYKAALGVAIHSLKILGNGAPVVIRHNFAVAVQKRMAELEQLGQSEKALVLAQKGVLMARDFSFERAEQDILDFQLGLAHFRQENYKSAARVFRDGYKSGSKKMPWKKNYRASLVNMTVGLKGPARGETRSLIREGLGVFPKEKLFKTALKK